MNASDKLAEIFARFPGIGPRQARRFVYYLLSASPSFRAELAKTITELTKEIRECVSCGRYFSNGKASECRVCSDKSRDTQTLMIVERDVDLISIEQSGAFKGAYAILGGSIPFNAEKVPVYIRLNRIQNRIKTLDGLNEIILAFSATPDGDSTARYVKEYIMKTFPDVSYKITTLGRGLSTGSELEYADRDTIRSA